MAILPTRNNEASAPSTCKKRRLLYFPIIHTQADLGELKEVVRQVKARRFGKYRLRRNQNLIEESWKDIERKLEGLLLQYETVRVYQDGLPVFGRELDVVGELASAGSRNHQLLLRLKEKGATIMGTESPELLVEEYQSAKRAFASADTMEAAAIRRRPKTIGDSLLKRRDQFIAARINGTLREHETGLLFLGLFHSVEQWLDNDIELIYPLGRASAGAGG